MNIFNLFRLSSKPILHEKFSGRGTVLLSFVPKVTDLASATGPVKMIELLKEHLMSQTKIIEKSSGVVLISIGDSILAYWQDTNAQLKSGQIAFNAARSMLSNSNPLLNYQIVLGTGDLTGDFFGTIKQFQIVGEAMIIADQLSKYRRNPPIPKREILFTEKTKSELKIEDLEFTKVGVLSNDVQIYSFATD